MKFLQHPITISSALVLALLVLGETLSPGFASLQQLQSLLIVSALLGIVAAGQNLVILGGREGIDLSVGGVISISALIGGNIMDGSNAGILPALVACLGAGAFFGLLNGLGVTLLRIPPLVMTLGMLGVLEGLLVVVRQGIPSGRAAPMLAEFVSKPQLLWLPGIIWLWIAIGLLMFFLLNKTVLGMRFFAIGANEPVARNVGVKVRWTRVRLYVFAGMFSAVTGLCILGYSGSSFANVGQQYMLASIIAVVLGGTPLAGGRGGYTGTMVGAVMLVVLQSILTTLNIEESGRQFIFGATLLLLLFLYGREKNLRN
ncbi:ABC transporter permease [Celeribacter sp.]|uniref:ABC transporter permease n=1 Tax=Celeribacter sp. TaxID=1890673 RepID=UPI003A94F865